MLLLCGCTVGGVEVEQERASGMAGELLDSHTFGQTLTPQYDGLYRMDLYTATYGRENTRPVIFCVRASPPEPFPASEEGGKDDLVRLELPAAQISNSGPTIITFPPLADTAGRTLYFSIESPGSVPGDAVTVYRDEEDAYSGGQMYVDGQPTGGDIAFIAYTQETFALADVWNDFYSRASQDKPFFIFYCSLLALLLVALVVTLAWSSHRPAENPVRKVAGDPTASTEPAADGPMTYRRPNAQHVSHFTSGGASAHVSRSTRRTYDRPFLFLILLAFAVLTQVVIFGWGPETIFFVTWLLLVLSVQHDSRISAAVGLAFLAGCPFLLIAGKDAVAEKAADYAFFFLAIGVLVQLEELLLDRYGCLERKLDWSHLWQPAAQAFRRRWLAAVRALGRQLAAHDRTELVRLVQIVGTAGLAVVFLWAAFTGAQSSVVLPLLGGAILFPFLVWGVRLVVRALGPAWMLRVALALIVLPLSAAGMVWLYDLAQQEEGSRMQEVYNLIDRRGDARRTHPTPEGELIEERVWTIQDVRQRVLYQHPAFSGASRLAYRLGFPRGTRLAFDVATAPESWTKDGDGVDFAIYVQSEHGMAQVFATHIDPKRNEADRRWHPFLVDLTPYAGEVVTLILETRTGPAGDYRYDWAGWGEPRLLGP